MKNHLPQLLLAVTVILSLVLGLTLIGKGPFNADAMVLTINAERSVLEQRIIFLHSHGYPLLSLVAAGFVAPLRLLGITDTAWAVNLISVLFSALALIPYYVLIRKLFDTSTAILSCVLLALNTLFLSLSVFGSSQPLALFLFLTALACLVSGRGPASRGNLVLFSVLFSLFAAARVQDAAVMLIPVTYLFFAFGAPRGLKESFPRYLASAAAIVLLTMLFYLPVIGERGWPFFQKAFHYHLTDPTPKTVSLYHLTLTAVFLLEIFLLPGSVLAAGGLALLAVKARKLLIFLGLWVLLPFWFFGNYIMTLPRLQYIALPAWVACQGALLSWLWGQRHPWLRALAILGFLAVSTLSFSAIAPVLEFRHQRALTVEFARWVGKQTEPNAVVIVGDEEPFLRYYGGRETLLQIQSDAAYYPDLREKLIEYKKDLDGKLQAGVPVYITEIGLLSNNDGLFYHFLTRYYRLECVGQAPMEVWHRSNVVQRFLTVRLYRLWPAAEK